MKGNFIVGGLMPGSYYLFAEPPKNAQSQRAVTASKRQTAAQKAQAAAQEDLVRTTYPAGYSTLKVPVRSKLHLDRTHRVSRLLCVVPRRTMSNT